jgi:hypothetical protein
MIPQLTVLKFLFFILIFWGKSTISTKESRVTRRFDKNCPIFQKAAQQSPKFQNICNKGQFESPKHLHQTTFENLKYLQQILL